MCLGQAVAALGARADAADCGGRRFKTKDNNRNSLAERGFPASAGAPDAAAKEKEHVILQCADDAGLRETVAELSAAGGW